jgi:hypothetical protein
MALRLGPLRIPWPEPKDPYWDVFVNRPVHDQRNLMQEALRSAGGAVNPTRADLHSPEITSDHLKQLARFLGAELVGVVRLTAAPVPFSPGDRGQGEGSEDRDPAAADRYPFAIVCAVRSDYDPRTALGVGGQVAVRNGRFVTFTLAAYIREMGYRATNQLPADEQRLAAAAGLGTLNREGRLVPPGGRPRVHVANEVIFTDLPLAADGEA